MVLFSYVTNLLSILQILTEIISHAHLKGEKSLNDFKFGTCIGWCPGDSEASMTVKGLNDEDAVHMVSMGLDRFCKCTFVDCSCEHFLLYRADRKDHPAHSTETSAQ